MKKRPFKMKARIEACTDGDNGLEQLMFYCGKKIQKRFDGKLVEITIKVVKQ